MYKTKIQKYETCTVLSLYFDTYVQFLAIFNTDDLPQINFVLQLQKVLLFHTCQELLHCCDVLSLSILLVPSLHCRGFHSMFLTHLPVKLVHMRMSRPMAFYLQWKIIRVIIIFSKVFSWQSMKFFIDVQQTNELYTREEWCNDKKNVSNWWPKRNTKYKTTTNNLSIQMSPVKPLIWDSVYLCKSY